MVDAGSAGCMTLPGLRKFIVEKSQTRILALLNIACHGMAGAGCSGTDFGPGGKELFTMQILAFQLYSYSRFVRGHRELLDGRLCRPDSEQWP